MKSLILLPLLMLQPMSLKYSGSFDSELYYETSIKEDGTYTLTGVKSEYLEYEELDVLYDDEHTISEITIDAFKDCTKLRTLVISNCVTIIPSDLFKNIPTLKYVGFTGSEEEFNALNLAMGDLGYDCYYSVEGFMNFWYDNVRTSEAANICDINDETFQKMLRLYSLLGEDERRELNAIKDGESTMIESIQYLKSIKNAPLPAPEKPDMNKSTMIAFILIIASVGMTFICIFYLLKERKVIK